MELFNPDNMEVFAKIVLDAVMSKNWALLASLLLILVVWGLRKFAGKKIPFLNTDAGGALSVLVLAVLGAVANSLIAGQALSGALILAALKVGFVAAGGYGMLKKVLAPLLLKLLPAKADPVEVVAEAEAEGEKAAGVVVKEKFEDLGKD